MPTARRYVSIADLPERLAVFPLTGALLLPRGQLPLNIFEPRYLAMVDAAMAGTRLIGMIQPRRPFADGQRDMSENPALAQTGCAGRITSYSETEDGRYLITLSGIIRFRIARELEEKTPFRQIDADYAPYAADLLLEEAASTGFESTRKRLLAALKPYFGERDMKTDWPSIEGAAPETLINALCMICPFAPPEKQALLEAPDLKARASALIALLEMANAMPLSGSAQKAN